MPNLIESYIKARQVVYSCVTAAQCDVARQYLINLSIQTNTFDDSAMVYTLQEELVRLKKDIYDKETQI
jgi:hypothetical protein